MTRYRLVPIQGRGSVFINGDEQAAREAAQAMFERTGTPVLVCLAPVDGIVRELFTVPPTKGKR